MNIACNAFIGQSSPAFHSGISSSDSVSITLTTNCFAFWLSIDKKNLDTFQGSGAGSMISENGAIWADLNILRNGSQVGAIFLSDSDITITESTAQTGVKHDRWYYMTANAGDVWTITFQTGGLRTTCSTLVGNQVVQLGLIRLGEYPNCRASRIDPQVAVYGNVGVTGTVSIDNQPTVNIGTMPNVSIGNTPSVVISGTPNVSVTGSVNVTNQPTVNIGNQPTVSIGNQPTVIIGNQPVVSLSGQPISVSLLNAVLTSSTKLNSYRIQTVSAGFQLRGTSIQACQTITWFTNMYMTISVPELFSYVGHYGIRLVNGTYTINFLVNTGKIIKWPTTYPGLYFGVVDQSLGPGFSLCVDSFDNHGLPDNIPMGLVVFSTGPPQQENQLKFLSE